MRWGVSTVVAVDKHPLGSGGRRWNVKIITAGGIGQTCVMRVPSAFFTASRPALSLDAIDIYTSHLLPPCQAGGTPQSGTPTCYYFRRFRGQIVSDNFGILAVSSLLYVSQGVMAAVDPIKLFPLSPAEGFHARKFACIMFRT